MFDRTANRLKNHAQPAISWINTGRKHKFIEKCHMRRDIRIISLRNIPFAMIVNRKVIFGCAWFAAD